jgi:predicted O-methyltransferase YrrM
MRTSYKNNIDYGDIFKTVLFLNKPKNIIEFGILDGFSLDMFSKYSSKDCKIIAYDIFEDFNGNSAEFDYITKKYKDDEKIEIKKGDFYKVLDTFDNDSLDIIHIDIANEGFTYDFAIKHGMRKLKKNGLLLMEGGSEARDKVHWMKKYKKPLIIPVLEEHKKTYNITTIGTFPGITIISK